MSKDAGAVFAHYARFVRPGDRRLHLECGDPFLRITAFVSEKNRRYVAVAVNNSKEVKAIRLQLSNLRWKPSYAGGLVTDAARALEVHPIAGVPSKELCYDAQLPPLSLATFVWAEADPGRLTLPKGVPQR